MLHHWALVIKSVLTLQRSNLGSLHFSICTLFLSQLQYYRVQGKKQPLKTALELWPEFTFQKCVTWLPVMKGQYKPTVSQQQQVF